MTKSKIDWPPTLYVVGYHLFLCIALPVYFFHYTPSVALLMITAALLFIAGIAVTAGYHRLYSHSSYKIHVIPEAILLFFASAATHGSALKWSYQHRLHHAFVDTDRDPYSIKKGFWYAHVFWMFYQSEPIQEKVVADLMRNKMVVFQHRYYGACMVVANTLIFLTVGTLLNDYLGSFLFTWFVRTFFLHHTTWSINSAAHTWGSKLYSEEHSGFDNYLLALITYGEGYHNYHHTFANDYRNGIRWYHFDPTKWLIWTLYKLGLAKDLRQVNDFRIARELISEHKKRLQEALKRSLNLGLEKRVNEIGESLLERINTMQSLYEKYKSIPRREAHTLRDQIRITKKEWKRTWKEWKRLIKLVNLVEPALRAH